MTIMSKSSYNFSYWILRHHELRFKTRFIVDLSSLSLSLTFCFLTLRKDYYYQSFLFHLQELLIHGYNSSSCRGFSNNPAITYAI